MIKEDANFSWLRLNITVIWTWLKELLKVEPAIISKWEYSAFQVDVINELKLLAAGEEDKSLKSRENYIYLLYCNSVINTSVGAITKVNGVFVFRLSNSKKLCWLNFLIISTIIFPLVYFAILRKNITEQE